MPRDPDAPGDGAMFAQIFTPSSGTSGRVNSPSFNSRVLLLMPTVRTPPNSGAGFKSEYGIEGTIFLASYFQKRRLPTPGSEYADRKSTRLNSSHQIISYAVFCL